MITLEQIKNDIATGKCKRIYYSTGTLWWTHSDDDVAEATEKGHLAQQKKTEKLLNDPDFPEEDKSRLRSLQEIIGKTGHKIPTDPSGAALYQADDVSRFISAAEEKPEHFGKHGVAAFIHSHHQNCNGQIFVSWSDINQAIDQEKNILKL